MCHSQVYTPLHTHVYTHPLHTQFRTPCSCHLSLGARRTRLPWAPPIPDFMSLPCPCGPPIPTFIPPQNRAHGGGPPPPHYDTSDAVPTWAPAGLFHSERGGGGDSCPPPQWTRPAGPGPLRPRSGGRPEAAPSPAAAPRSRSRHRTGPRGCCSRHCSASASWPASRCPRPPPPPAPLPAQTSSPPPATPPQSAPGRARADTAVNRCPSTLRRVVMRGCHTAGKPPPACLQGPSSRRRGGTGAAAEGEDGLLRVQGAQRGSYACCHVHYGPSPGPAPAAPLPVPWGSPFAGGKTSQSKGEMCPLP